MQENGNWEANSKLVKSEIARLSESIERNSARQQDRFDILERLIADLRVELATVKVKAGLFGALAGSLPTLVYLTVQVFLHQK